MLKPDIKNYFKVPVINDSNHNIAIMKNIVIVNLEYVKSTISLEVRANTGDPTRIGNAAIIKSEVIKANEPTADSKEYSAGVKDDHYQKVLEKIDPSELTNEKREQVREMLKKAQCSLLTMMT